MAKKEDDNPILFEIEKKRSTQINLARRDYIIEKSIHEKVIPRDIFKLYDNLTEEEIIDEINKSNDKDENPHLNFKKLGKEEQSLTKIEYYPTEKETEIQISYENFPKVNILRLQGSSSWWYIQKQNRFDIDVYTTPYEVSIKEALEKIPELQYPGQLGVPIYRYKVVKGYFDSKIITLIVIPDVLRRKDDYYERGRRICKQIDSYKVTENVFGMIIDKIIHALKKNGIDYKGKTKVMLTTEDSFVDIAVSDYCYYGTEGYETKYGLIQIERKYREGILIVYSESIEDEVEKMRGLIKLKEPEQVTKIDDNLPNKGYSLFDLDNPIVKKIEYPKPKKEEKYQYDLVSSQLIYKNLNSNDKTNFAEIFPDVLQSIVNTKETKGDPEENERTIRELLDTLDKKEVDKFIKEKKEKDENE